MIQMQDKTINFLSYLCFGVPAITSHKKQKLDIWNAGAVEFFYDLFVGSMDSGTKQKLDRLVSYGSYIPQKGTILNCNLHFFPIVTI